MIEIVKANDKKCLLICKECKCIFTATVSDLIKGKYRYFINCPQCSNDIEVDFFDDGTFNEYWNVYHEKLRRQEEKENKERRLAEEARNKRKNEVSIWRRILGLY